MRSPRYHVVERCGGRELPPAPSSEWWTLPVTTRTGAGRQCEVADLASAMSGVAGSVHLAALLLRRARGHSGPWTRYGATCGLNYVVRGAAPHRHAPRPDRVEAQDVTRAPAPWAPWVMPVSWDARAAAGRAKDGEVWAWAQTISGYQLLFLGREPQTVWTRMGKSERFRAHVYRVADAARLRVTEVA